TGLSLLVDWALEPLHARGYVQSLSGYVNGLDHLLQAFGMKAAAYAGLIPGHHLTTAAWYFSRGVSLLLWFAAGFWLGTIWYRVRARRATAASETGPSRRRFLSASLKLVGGSAAVAGGYALFVEPRWFTVTHRVIPLRNLPPELNGLRAVQLTDVHHGPW